jgi:hypothetical protein
MMRLTAVLGGVALALAGVATVQLVEGESEAGPTSKLRLASVTGTTTGTTTGAATRTATAATTERGIDVSGPCDEAEHARDPRCASVPAPARPATTAGGGVDIPGPCDEPEHANDPRCTGGARADDRSGPGRGRGGDEDRSGRRGGEAEDDHSGRGRGGNDDDDRSGSNSGRG